MIIITGTGRSGTSAMSGAMEEAGYPMALRDELIGANWSNEKGNFEATSVKEFHEQWLKEDTGTSHDWDFFNLPSDLESLGEDRENAILKLGERIGEGAVIKDPRFTFTLPAWRKLCPVEAVIYVFRDPMGVSQSLYRRDGMPIITSLKMWTHWIRAFEKHTSFTETILVEYESLLHNPGKVMEMISRRLGDNPAVDSVKVEGFVDTSLSKYKGNPGNNKDAESREIHGNLRKQAAVQLEGGASRIKRGEISLLAREAPMTADMRLRLYSEWIAGSTQNWREISESRVVSSLKLQVASLQEHVVDLKLIVKTREEYIERLEGTLGTTLLYFIRYATGAKKLLFGILGRENKG